MLFSLLKHHLDLNITDTALKVSPYLYFFTTSVSHGVENYFPRLWGMGVSDAIFNVLSSVLLRTHLLMFDRPVKYLCECVIIDAWPGLYSEPDRMWLCHSV